MIYAEYLDKINLVRQANTVYYQSPDAPMFSDEDYDTLVDQIQAAEEANGWNDSGDLFTTVAGGSVNDADESSKVIHEIPMLSLGKVKDVKDVFDFIAETPNAAVAVEPKLDGVAVSVLYMNGKLNRVATRRDADSGENVTDRIKVSVVKGLPATIPVPGRVEVRGEIFITKPDFVVAQKVRAAEKLRLDTLNNKGRVSKLFMPFVNPRNAVAGILLRKVDKNEHKTLPVTMTFGAYDVIASTEAVELQNDSHDVNMDFLKKVGFLPANSFLPAHVKAAKDVATKISLFGDARLEDSYPIPTDGVVIKFDSQKVKQRLGIGSKTPKYAIAYKYEDEVKTTRLLRIDRAVGRTGAVSYTAILETVHFDTAVSAATLNNADFINNLDIHINDVVRVRKANQIIPQILGVVKVDRPADAVKYVAPTTCPVCGKDLDTTSSVVWRCETPSCLLLGRLQYAVSRDCLDIDKLGVETLQDLVARGWVKELHELFLLSADDLAKVRKSRVKADGENVVLGDKVGAELYSNLQKAKEQTAGRVLTALGIRMTGRSISRRLIGHFGSIKKLQEATVVELQEIEGIKDKAAVIKKGLEDNRQLLANFKALGFKALQDTVATTVDAPKPLKGVAVVVSGAVPGYTRITIQERIEELGGRASSGVSSSTGLLVADEASGSSKVKKAQQLGVKIVSPDEFLVIIS